jgi:hypothetical protein
MWQLPPAYYENGAPVFPAVLRFSGEWCELRILRDTTTPGQKDGEGDADGSPPPPDPGDESSEASFLALEVERLKRELMELKALQSHDSKAKREIPKPKARKSPGAKGERGRR